jgi:GT2 family glycosyltransferase
MDPAHSGIPHPGQPFVPPRVERVLQPVPEHTDAQPLVSLVVVTYNNADEADRLSDSLNLLTYPNVESILIDNGSVDGTVDRFATACPDMLVAAADPLNPGYGSACNRGVSLAQGEIIVFLNCDVELEPNAIDRLVAPIFDDDAIGAVMAKLLVRGEDDIVNATAGSSHFLGFSWNEHCLQPDTEPDADDVHDVGFVCGAAVAVRRSAFEDVCGFDNSFFMYVEDADLSWRMRIAGWRTVVASGARVHHDYVFFTGDRRFCYYAERNRLAMLLKCYRWWSLLLLLPLFVCTELVVIGYAARERWLLAKLRAYGGVVTDLPNILKGRRQVAASRAPGGTLWTAQLSGAMSSPHFAHPLVRAGNAVLIPLWGVLRRAVR